MKFLGALLTVLLSATSISTFPTRQKKLIYFTLDDGPNAFTVHALDAAKRAGGVPLTFFSVGNAFDPAKWGESNVKKFGEYLWRAFLEGHLLADHSSDHMAHNGPKGAPTPIDAYQNVETDLG